jgi:hypothetical protein
MEAKTKKASFLGEVIANFNPMQPLDEKHSDWYVEQPDSPHERIKICLLNNPDDIKVLFSGHIGSGKTSTLKKLVLDSEIKEKFFVVQFSAHEELNIADLGYTDLLIAIGKKMYEDGEKEKWVSKDLNQKLNEWAAVQFREWGTEEAAGIKIEGGISAWFMKATGLLKTGFKDKRTFREKMEPQIPQLIQFINEIIEAIEFKSGKKVLLVLEDLDKPPVEKALDLFLTKGTILIQPRCKILFTVPISVLYSGKFNIISQTFPIQFVLPNFKVVNKDGTPNEEIIEKMKNIVYLRMNSELIEKEALTLAVKMSGGVVRELIRIINGAAISALAKKENVIHLEDVEDTVNQLAQTYKYSLTKKSDIEILKKVEETKKLIDDRIEDVRGLLHGQFILQYPNGEGWYGVNPIVKNLIKD